MIRKTDDIVIVDTEAARKCRAFLSVRGIAVQRKDLKAYRADSRPTNMKCYAVQVEGYRLGADSRFRGDATRYVYTSIENLNRLLAELQL